MNRNDRRFRLWRQMPRLRAGEMKLALQVSQGDAGMRHGHVGRAVAEQSHEGGQADAGAIRLLDLFRRQIAADRDKPVRPLLRRIAGIRSRFERFLPDAK